MKRTDNFSKFASRKKNSAIKEEFRQEKKKWKKERSEAIEKKKLELRAKTVTLKGLTVNKGKGGLVNREKDSLDQAPVTIRKQDKSMPLNKYVAHCGVCSRRDAVDLIKDGKLKVNDTVILEPGFKVMPEDVVHFSGKRIYPEKNLIYILLNKPKDYITTSEDPEGRKTVLDLVRGATNERLFPVGRLDRNTTGVLLLTNDGDMTQKLSHPSNEVRKIYEVKLDKPLSKVDFDKVLNGIELEDGFVRADALAYADGKDKSVLGIELHSGRNRVVRRIFEFLGYDVRNLDRVMYGNLTKKNVDRGKWRFLNEKEIRLLKFMNSSFIKRAVDVEETEKRENREPVNRRSSETVNRRNSESVNRRSSETVNRRNSESVNRRNSESVNRRNSESVNRRNSDIGGWKKGGTEKTGGREDFGKKQLSVNKEFAKKAPYSPVKREEDFKPRKFERDDKRSSSDHADRKLKQWEQKLGAERPQREGGFSRSFNPRPAAHRKPAGTPIKVKKRKDD